MRFWARALTSLLLLSFTLAAWGDPSLTLGGIDYSAVPSFVIDDTGFRIDRVGADRFRFYESFKDPKSQLNRPGKCFVRGRDFSLNPSALRVEPYAPGFELYFAHSFELGFRSNLAPYLSWAEGTVDAEVPSAPSRWVLVSFQDGQAPVLMLFDEPQSLVVTGSSGDWRLRTVENFKGWVRFVAPIGTQTIGSSASALGHAVQKLVQIVPLLQREAPQLVDLEIREEENAITGVWEFDRVGAMVPQALMLTKSGGYPVSIQTGIKTLAELPEGPLAVTLEPRLVVRFPMKRIATGRSLSVGKPPDRSWTVDINDYKGLSELALASLASAQSSSLTVESDRLERALISSTGELQFSPQLDIAAAQAFFLMADFRSQNAAHPDVVSKFESLIHPNRWRLVGSADVADRASGLLSLAAGLSSDPHDRLIGAILHAGISAQQGLSRYRIKRGYEDVAPLAANPFSSIRLSLYSEHTSFDPYLRSLLSQVRVIGRVDCSATRVTGGYLLQWVHEQGSPHTLTLISGFPLEVEARKNLKGVAPVMMLGTTLLGFTPSGPGLCEVYLKLPNWADTLPDAVPVPHYVE